MLETLPLDRPLAFIDLETTGLSTTQDRIVEMALLRLDPDGKSTEKVRRFNPEIPIPAGASAIHGITDADVADKPAFRARARSLFDLLDPCDLAGFNVRRFDLPMLLAEFQRSGFDFNPYTRRIVDVQQIFHNEEPRDLSAATRFYLSRELENAHSALADIRVSAEILAAQLGRYHHLPNTVDGLHGYCDAVGAFQTELDRWFSRDDDDGLVFRRGKHKGVRLDAIAATESDYLMWMLSAEDMPFEVIRAVQAALHGPPDPDQVDLPLSDSDAELPGRD